MRPPIHAPFLSESKPLNRALHMRSSSSTNSLLLDLLS
jgi:hypothetical protein